MSKIAALQAKLGGGAVIMRGMRPGAARPVRKKKQPQRRASLDNSALLDRTVVNKGNRKKKRKKKRITVNFDALVDDEKDDPFAQSMTSNINMKKTKPIGGYKSNQNTCSNNTKKTKYGTGGGMGGLLAKADDNMIIFESDLNKKGKFNKAMQKRHCIAYTDRKFAYFRHPKDTLPAGYIKLPTVSTINIYLPKNHNSTDYDEKSWSLTLKDISLKGNDNSYGFELVTSKRKWVFGCSDYNIFDQWIRVLRELCFGRLLHSGYLRKLGEKYKTWRRRFFVIYDVNEIRYFENKNLENEKGKIELNKVTKIRETNSNDYHFQNCIELHTNKRIWVLATDSKKERNIWVNGIKSIMKKHERTFLPKYNGWVSIYNDVTGRFQRYYFALESTLKANRLCCFESQIAFKQLQSITCYGDIEYNLQCKQKMKHIYTISLNSLIDVLIITSYEFNTVNVGCKYDMTEYEYIFHIKLMNNISYYLCPHPNTHRMAQKWVNVIKNNEIKGMIDRMAKPMIESQISNSKSPTSPIPISLNETNASYNKILNDKRDVFAWTNNDVLLWIKAFDNGLIVSKYPNIINQLKKFNINGMQLKQLNAINLQQFGVEEELHRALILEGISLLQ